jgi:hypothetical protein
LMQAVGPVPAFAVFDSPTRRIGLNLRHMIFSQFDGRPAVGLRADAMPDTSTMDIVFAESKEPLRIEIGPNSFELSVRDYGARSAVTDNDPAAALVQVAILFSYCETLDANNDCLERLQDVTTSPIWIRWNDVALVSAPIAHLNAERRRVIGPC